MEDRAAVSGAKRPKSRAKSLFWVGLGLSVAYLALIGTYWFGAQAQFVSLKPNEFGDFLAGAFSPLAFLWLVLGYMQQGEELKNSADALWLQGEELQNSVTQQRQLVEVTREQLAHEREALAAADRRVAAASAAADARDVQAKIEAHNEVIDRITTLGVVATDEAQSHIAEQTAGYAFHLGSIEGDLGKRRMAELREALPGIKNGARDPDLLGAINHLENVLEPKRVRGEGCNAYVAALEERFDEIHEALMAVDGLRRR